MFNQPLTKTERDELVKRANRLMRERNAALDRKDLALARVLLAQSTAVQQEYFQRLPMLSMSCCPHCNEPLIRPFDPFGLDGDWWRPDVARPAPTPCRHFCLLRGALNFKGLKVVGGNFDAYTGPEVPYVIPRILSMPTMVAVIGELTVLPGFAAFPIAYFAKRRPPVQDLTANWPDKTFTWVTALGEKGWNFPNDPWDFDLLKWINQDRLKWCAPGSGNERLASGSPQSCPYLKVQGKRTPQVVDSRGAGSRPLPDGSVILPIQD